MIPGPNYLKRCPNCESYVIQSSARSQNTFGATWWTDGGLQAPMYKHYADIFKCSSCKVLYRLSEQPPVDVEHFDHMTGDISRENEHSAWEQALYLIGYDPGLKIYLEAIETDLVPNKAIEKETRLRAWRSFNNKFRKKKREGKIEWAPDAKGNAEALIDLLDENESAEGVIRAELLRELSRFDEALEQLRSLDLSEEDIYAKQIYALSEKQNPNLALLEF